MEEIKENIHFSFYAVGLLWIIYFISLALPFHLQNFGIHPRSISGLLGIPLAPFVHGNLSHLISNSLALFILLSLAMTHDRSLTIQAVVFITIGGGLGTWMFGSNGVHIGASGIIFGLIGYLLVLGYYRRDIKSFLISLIVLFSYGFSLILALIPTPGISWTGHFFGAVAGVCAARRLKDAS